MELYLAVNSEKLGDAYNFFSLVTERNNILNHISYVMGN